VRYLPDLVIIGGGVVGAATAFYAARAGMRPLLLERRPALCTLTTPASTGAFRLQFDNEEELRLVRESVDLFLNFNEITEQDKYDLGIRQQGYLWCTTEEAGVRRQARLVERQHAWGQTDVELLDGEEVRRRFPYIRETVVQARFRAGDGFLDPKALTLGLAVASGAEVRTGCEVTGFEISGGKLTAIRTGSVRIPAQRAVIACGPFSGALARRAGVELPVRPVIRQKVVLPALPEVPPDAPMTIDDDVGTHWRPALRGAYLLFTDPETPAGEPLEDVPTDHRFAFQLLDPASPVAAARITPFWERIWARASAHWLLHAGQYTMTPDHRPLIGETEIGGLWVNTGYSGHGIMGSPAGSRILIDCVTGKAGTDNPFRLDRQFRSRERDVL
jgi:sarcosine oxidase subunit beta